MALITEHFHTDILAVLVSLFAIIYTYFKWSYKHWSAKGVPSLETKIPFGTVADQSGKRQCPGVKYQKVYNKFKEQGHRHGGIYVFTAPFYFPLDPEIVKCVIAKDFNHFTDRGLAINEKTDPISAHLITIRGEEWRNMRSKLTPTFSSGKMKMMFPTLVECARNLQEAVEKIWEQKKVMDAKDVLACYTTDVIGSCAFGLDCQSFKDEDSPFRKHGRMIFETSRLRSLKRILNFAFPNLSKYLGTRLVKKEVSDFFVQIVADAVQYRETNNVCRRDFLQLLIDVRNGKDGADDDGKKQLTIEQMAAQAFAFFATGFETSSTTMSFCLYQLAVNQDIQEKVRKEVFQMLEKHGGKLSYEAVQDMKYMEMVVDETLRMYPALPSLNRECTDDYQIPDTDVLIEKGTRVMISILGLHHDPEYFPNPERFDPERFSEENKNDIRPYTYLPFGDGPRNCLGLRFGITQSKVGLAVLLKNYKFYLNSRTKTPLTMAPRSLVLTAEGGIWLDVEKI